MSKGDGVLCIFLFCGVFILSFLLAPWSLVWSVLLALGVSGGVTALHMWLGKPLKRVFTMVGGFFSQASAVDILVSLGGLIVGLVIGVLLTYPISFLPFKNAALPLVVTLICGALGLTVFLLRKEDIVSLFTGLPRVRFLRGQGGTNKILDTSAIVDGRIADICKTGFLEGELIIPRFVLRELQQVADSQDPLKRSRGRRGLDILNRMRKEKKVTIRIVDRDFPDIRDVDAKLIKLAKIMGARVITNDFNLNKIAELEGVEVLNINELSNALKPYVLPGEELRVQIIREGKEAEQGVGYLDDGTMVVVEEGKKYINSVVDTIVTSVLQTPAGRMIFARLKTKG
ncbi:PIN/TRAM domain-containing protein [Candidatus Caldatribacterium sp.]|uniref:PIN/TRAM domain-containing protein n=1 Tax=Candidatus Caldatribacterium sp. TaxID=2282143 RepID=UPI0029948A4C|nr:PIN domain nuclease [Candidatus Caldatribacterium sp.]MDW8080307.1 PIN domain nuclease [Candidatus Calescibacterium sp.]